MQSIFVQISSYSDLELPETINDLIKKSSGKYFINIGVYNLLYGNDYIELPKINGLNVATENSPSGIGLGYGRLQAHNFYDGEDYYLQIDSHTKMNFDWDSQIVDYIKEYKSLGFEKPLLTNYPRNYWYDSQGNCYFDEGEWVSQISFSENPKQFKDTRIPTQTSCVNPKGNIFSKSVSGGSIFTVGDFIKPNPRVAFYGEEILLAARAYTNGFDLLIPKKQFMYHLYYDHNNPEINKRRLIWQDWETEFNSIDISSRSYIYDVFTKNYVGDEELGTERSLKSYGDFVGLDFNTGEIYKTCYD